MEKEELLDMTIDELFNDPSDQENNDDTQPDTQPVADKPTTEEVSKRINEVKQKTEIDTQDRIAKELGFENYAELQKANSKKILSDAGIDSEDKVMMDAIDRIVERRLASDPRMKRLEEIEKSEKTNFVTNQLVEINKFAGTAFSSIEELPKETLALWEKTGNLKQAYLATEGEALLLKKNATINKGTTTHLANPGASPTGNKTRCLTEEEKAIYRSVMPDITEDELSKKTIDVE